MNELQHKPACSKCKSAEGMVWRRDKSHRQGGRWRCKPCSQAYMVKYRKDNPEKWDKLLDRYHSDPELREKRKEGMRLRAKANRAKIQEEREKDPVEREKQRLWAMGSNLKTNYGISLDQYRALYEAQGGKCRLCGVEKSAIKGGRAHRLCVDHCHKTGHIRGLLCKSCNTALGAFQDDPIRLQKAIDYLNGGNRSLVSAVLHSVDEGAADGGASDSGADADPRLSRIGA